ncbi:MAG: protein kinase [Kofleriaceae bacterium]
MRCGARSRPATSPWCASSRRGWWAPTTVAAPRSTPWPGAGATARPPSWPSRSARSIARSSCTSAPTATSTPPACSATPAAIARPVSCSSACSRWPPATIAPRRTCGSARSSRAAAPTPTPRATCKRPRAWRPIASRRCASWWWCWRRWSCATPPATCSRNCAARRPTSRPTSTATCGRGARPRRRRRRARPSSSPAATASSACSAPAPPAGCSSPTTRSAGAWWRSLLHGGGARGGPAFERFGREARVAAALRHPSLVEIYDVALEHGVLVMEYLPGGSLAQRLGVGERFTEAAVRRLGLELLAGLEVAHHRGVVHRDVKPANVFFDARGTGKLGDFGVAHLVDLGQTQTGGLIGTLAYMSPEQITGAPITVAADLYALGVTLFEALTGRLPFLGPDYVAQHLGEVAPLPSTIRPELGPGWDGLLEALLRKAPGERPALTAARAALEGLAASGPAVMLPRPRARPSSVGPVATPTEEPAAEVARYQHETALGRTEVSRLARAVDRVLDRSVVIERFDDSEPGRAALARVRTMAAASSPFVQRALAWDHAERTAVFEAPAGAPWADAVIDPSPAPLGRLLKRLARALGALHELGVAHAALTPTTIVVDDGHIPTLLAAGLGAPTPATPADDVAAIVALVTARLGLAPTWPALAAALAPGIDAPFSPGADGAALYAALDRLEVARLRAG